MHLDATDQAIIAALTADARASFAEIGQAVSLVVIYRWYAPQLVAKHKLRYPQAEESAAWDALVAKLPTWPRKITTD